MDRIIIDKQNFGEKMALLYAYLLKKPKQEFEIIQKDSELYIDSEEYQQEPRETFDSMESCIADLEKKQKKLHANH